ncbi:MAG: hypothetical protein BMS9Abin18_0385 [Zetaproteobacteria bacterium]|nr:MAG: hypothetical protein BMS9Abin18_0385 [Zetaproteobacteria bacterium]
MITTQFTPDLPDNCVKHAHLQEQTARVFLALEQIMGNLSSYINSAESLY